MVTMCSSSVLHLALSQRATPNTPFGRPAWNATPTFRSAGRFGSPNQLVTFGFSWKCQCQIIKQPLSHCLSGQFISGLVSLEARKQRQKVSVDRSLWIRTSEPITQILNFRSSITYLLFDSFRDDRRLKN